MRFLSNAHTHTTYCDGKSTIGELIAQAKTLGFTSLGFSGHGEQGFEEYGMENGREQGYLAELRRCQQQEKELRIWVGVEEDIAAPEAIKDRHRQQMDYVLSSSHYLMDETGHPIQLDGEWVAIDGGSRLLRRYVDEKLDGDGLALVQQYYDRFCTALLERKPDIIGHFDLVRLRAVKAGLFDENDPAYRRMALEALERIQGVGVLELNNGAIARGYMTLPYPTLELLGAWREMGGQVTITSDCHLAETLDCNFDASLRLLCRAGYRHVLALGQGDELWQEHRVAVLRG